MTPVEVLELPMQPNDAGAPTVRAYLTALLLQVWIEEEGFSGKRPFGNSGWKAEVEEALVRAGVVRGEMVDDYLNDCDESEVERLIRMAIDYMGSELL